MDKQLDLNGTIEPIGATGKFPQGKLNQNDEGELRIAVTIEKGKVIIHFGKKIMWLGFDKQQAHNLINLIKEKADQL